MLPANFCLLRGLGREAAHWGSFVDLLKQQPFVSEIHCIDLPGTGRFNQLTSPLSIRENAEFVLSQWPVSGAPQVILSVSLGSMVALEMAKLKPDRFEKVYVMNTSLSNLSPFYHRLQLHAMRRFVAMARSKDLKTRELECLKMVSQNSSQWAKLSQSFAAIAEARPMKLSNLLRQLLAAAIYKIDLDPLETSIEVMTSLGDEMVSPECSKKLATHWGAPLHQHPTAGHDIAIDDSQWIVDILKKTL